jgi:putative photosynthetic complex assembly protein
MTAYSPVERGGHDPDEIYIPRPILYALIALILFTIAAVATGRALQRGVTHEDRLHPTREVAFTFATTPDNALVATRADGRRVTMAGANEEIFPRLILRGLATLRTRDAADQRAPVRLLVMRDGQRLLVDGATGRVLRLAAFGPENGHSFDALLAEPRR